MVDRSEAINCIQDLIDVANNRGSAYVYKHNGGVERLENALACLIEKQGPIIQAERVTFGNAEGKFHVTVVEPTADEMFRELGYEKCAEGYRKNGRNPANGNYTVIKIHLGYATKFGLGPRGGVHNFAFEVKEIKAVARLIEEMEVATNDA